MRKLSLITVALALAGCAFDVGPEVIARRDAATTRDAPDAVLRDDDAPPADAPDDPTVDEPAPLPAWDASLLFTGVRDGRIRGSIGAVHGLDASTDIARVYDDGWYTQLEVYALRSDGQRVMIQLAIDNAGGAQLLVPGVGVRMWPGQSSAGHVVTALACQGPDSGDADEPFEDTDFDEEPCDVAIDGEQDPEDPQTLRVSLAVTFADDDGACPDLGDGEEPLPDDDGDGDGDLPPDPSGDPSDDAGAYPLAVSTFALTR